MNTIETRKRTDNNLGQVQTVLVSLANSLQLKVDRTIQDQKEIGSKLAHDMNALARALENTDDIKLVSLPSTTSPTSQTCQAIHLFRDVAVSTLRSQAKILSINQLTVKSGSTNEDFDMAADSLDTSFQQLWSWMDQLSMAWDALEQLSIERGARGLLEQIDNLAREAAKVKMSELSSYSCSLQSGTPKKFLVDTLDVLEITELARNAKKILYEVIKQTLEAMISVNDVEVAATEIYNKLIDEDSELHRRYDVYRELEFNQRLAEDKEV